jgi:hypothetical protein
VLTIVRSGGVGRAASARLEVQCGGDGGFAGYGSHRGGNGGTGGNGGNAGLIGNRG